MLMMLKGPSGACRSRVARHRVMPRRLTAIAGALTLAASANAVGQAVDVAVPAEPAGSRTLTSLQHLQFAEKGMTPDEDRSLEVGRYSQAIDAIAITYDPATKTQFVLVEPGTRLPNPPAGPEFVTAPYSRAELDATIDTVFAEWAAGRGGRALGASVDASNGKVHVITSSPQVAFSPVMARLGDRVEVEYDPRLGAGSGSRFADSAPHWGGGRISRVDGSGTCSSGPSIRVGGVAYGTTAGHCGPNGSQWTSGGNAHGYTNARPDYVQATTFTGPYSTDIERITNSTWAARLFFSPTIINTNASLPVVGAGDPVSGVIWNSGQTTGSSSGSVTDTTYQYCDSTTPIDGLPGGACFNNLFKTNNAIPDNGDSGGVCHTRSGSDQAGVRGTLSGVGSSGASCVRWSRIATVLGATIMT